MTFVDMQVKWSMTLTDRLGPEILTVLEIKGQVLHHGNTESRKNLEQKLIFQLGTLSPHGINERLSFH